MRLILVGVKGEKEMFRAESMQWGSTGPCLLVLLMIEEESNATF
jgi:hypothetical protein